MSHFYTLGLQIAAVGLVRDDHEWQALSDINPTIPKRIDLSRVIRQQPNAGDPQVAEYQRGTGVIALIGGEPELQVGLDRVEALILQMIGTQLVDQPDPAA